MTETIDLGSLAEDGWTTTRLLDHTGLAAARRLVDKIGLPADHPFFASPAQAWGAEARAIDAALKQLVTPRLTELLPDHRPFMAGVTSKGASGIEIRFHQDWTYTDERRERAVFLWCPLVDTDESNGGLAVVPRSHKWTEDIRPSRRSQPTEHLQRELSDLSTPVALAAGEAVVFDPATFHGSGPNTTDSQRPAFTVSLIPVGARLVHFHEADDGSLSGHLVDDAFFTVNPYCERPVGYEPIAPHRRAVTADDFERAIARETAAIRAGR